MHASLHPLAPTVAEWQRLTGAQACSGEQLSAGSTLLRDHAST
jgi:hypothetical protein